MRFLDAYAILLLNEQKGEAYSYRAVYKDLGMAGAIMLDLFVAQKISILCNENKKKYPHIVLQDGNATGDAIVDETLQYLRDSKGPQTLREGLSATCKQYKQKWEVIYARLENEGILRADDVKKVFGSQKWYFLNRPELKQSLLNDVFAFSGASEAPSFFLLGLITLLNSTNLLKKYLEKHYQHLREWRPFYGRFYQYVSKKIRQEETDGNLRFINEIARTIEDIMSSRSA